MLLAALLLCAPQDTLVTRFPAERVAAELLAPADWRPYPRAGEPGWAAIPADVRELQVAAAEPERGQPWPALPASLFLDYARSGNRTRYQGPCFERRERLARAVLAECIEAQGRFLDEVLDGVWLLCEETWWGIPAHATLHASGEGLPDPTSPAVDLFAAETGALLAWIDYLLGERLDGLSPLVRPRLRAEVERRILAPCREREDFWWMGANGRRVNNWNPWIVSNWLACSLLLDGEVDRRAADVHRALTVLDRFYAPYPADGGCDEGPGYWARAAASLFDALDLVHSASGGALDAYDLPKLRGMALYLPRVQLADTWFVNFADTSARFDFDSTLVYRFGRALGEPALIGFAAEAFQRQHVDGPQAVRGRYGVVQRALPALFSISELRAAEPTGGLPRGVWLPDVQVMVARPEAGSTRGFTVAAKGGHNAESHNHNDVGNVIVFLDGEPLLVDAGVGTYTKQTFSGDRYSLWTMRSTHHNVPQPGGLEQSPGESFRCDSALYAGDAAAGASLQLSLAEAYPRGRDLLGLTREVQLRSLEGDAVEVIDTVRFAGEHAPNAWVWMTPREVEVEPGRLLFPARGEGRAAQLTFPADFMARVEELPLEDPRLTRVWGSALRRVVLTSPHAQPEERVVFEVTPR